jgi:RNA polymerase sigma-70 factor (ECF subfamily)
MADSVPHFAPGMLPAVEPWAQDRPDAARVVDDSRDDDALAASARGDRRAYAELYRRHAPAVYRYMLVKVGHLQDAQDLTAQTFLAGLENISSYRGRGRFAAWLFGIARRKAVDYYRRVSGRDALSLDNLDDLPHPGQGPDEACEAVNDHERLAVALRRLAPDRAEALALRVFADRSVSEIAELMERSEPAVRMLVSRAIQDLRKALA